MTLLPQPERSDDTSGAGSIVVGVRVRPLTANEQYGSQRSLIRVVDDKVLCFDPACGEDMHVGKPVRGPHKIGHRAAKDQAYAFDCVFDSNVTQEVSAPSVSPLNPAVPACASPLNTRLWPPSRPSEPG
jgi:hypothetical protein